MAKSPSVRSAAAERDVGAEIATLQDLSQAAAAWLLGINGRSLRDSNAPRNRGGSYNAADVVAWRLDRPRKAVTLSDDQYEMVLHIVDRLAEHIGSVRDGIDRLTKELGSGDEVLGLIFRAMLDDWDASHRLCPDAYPWGGQDIGGRFIVCCDCKKVRRGRQWKAMTIPRTATDVRGSGYCPDCNRKHRDAHPGRHDWRVTEFDEDEESMPLIGETDSDFQATETT